MATETDKTQETTYHACPRCKNEVEIPPFSHQDFIVNGINEACPYCGLPIWISTEDKRQGSKKADAPVLLLK